MKISHRIAAIALILASHPVLALDANEEITAGDIGYQYLVYAVTWQPSFCRLKPETPGCDPSPEKLLTHGVWPYNTSTATKTNRHPAFCNTAPGCLPDTACEISHAALDEITHRPDILRWVTTDPRDMFKHEWKKHGTCSGKTEQDYFSAFADLRKVVVYDEPRFNAWIGRSVMFDELKTAFPRNTSFRCFVRQGRQVLHEVFYLVDTDGAPYLYETRLQIGTPCNAQETFIPASSQPDASTSVNN